MSITLGLLTALTGAEAYSIEGTMTPGHTLTKAIFMSYVVSGPAWGGHQMSSIFGGEFPADESTAFTTDAMGEPSQFVVFGLFDTDHVTVSFEFNYAANAVGHSFESEFPGWTEPEVIDWINNDNYEELGYLCDEFKFEKFSHWEDPGAVLVSYSDGVIDGDLTINAVPEPATFAVVGLGLAAMLRRRSKSRA